MEVKEVRFARTGENHVAWQEFVGDAHGDHEIVMVNGGFFPIESLPADPMAGRLIEGLAGLGRLVTFDRRGIGLSDPIDDWDTPPTEQWTDDLAAVIDDARLEKPTIFSWIGQAVARRYAVRRPDRISRLVLFNPDSPVEDRDHRWLEAYRDGLKQLQEGEGDDLMWRVWPGRWADPDFRAWVARAGRSGASPSEASRYRDWMYLEKDRYTFDNRDVSAPTLVVVRGDGIAPVEYHSRAASEIPSSELVDLGAGDAMAIGNGVDDLLAEITRYLAGQVRLPPPERILAAILLTDIVRSTEQAGRSGDAEWKRILSDHDEVYRRAVERAGGELIKSTGDGILALLPSASAAVAVAGDARDELTPTGIEVRTGIHVGEVSRRGDDISGLAVHVAARLMATATAGQIVVSDMVTRAADGGSYTPLGKVELDGIDGSWDLYEA